MFEARLEGVRPIVKRTLALSAGKTLVGLHQLIQEAFEWDDDHLYSFWLDGTFWGAKETEYSAPYDLEESGAKSARTRLDRLALEPGRRIAYVFDFGDEWRVFLKLKETREDGATGILERTGDPPPQYPDYDEAEEE